MRKNAVLILFFCGISASVLAQASSKDSISRQEYLAKQKELGRTFSNYFYSDFPTVHSQQEKLFVARLDSFRHLFDKHLQKYEKDLSPEFVITQKAEIKFYFDKLLLDYPEHYKMYTGKKLVLSPAIQKKLDVNINAFNQPQLLDNSDFREYVKAFIHHRTNDELAKNDWKGRDNQHLTIAWQLIQSLFTNQQCRDFWEYEYLYNHIDNTGIKNIDTIYASFLVGCKDSTYKTKIRDLYASDSYGRQGHIVETYKSIDGFKLDIHIFSEDSLKSKPRPVIVFFHGGSWTEGKPDWFFESCKSYAKKGWVACAVEYRIVTRHNSTPFESVKDARSAIRWLRKNASAYMIDTSQVIVSGNSAGGHLALTTALADQWNEKGDDMNYSATPAIVLVNAGVYDLNDRNTTWITAGLPDRSIVKKISPNELTRKVKSSFLIVHGTNDRNCPFPTAETFVQKMKQAGNDIEFYPVAGAGHFIWYDPKYSGQISSTRTEFLKTRLLSQ
jgi:acetyl esterase/lipase